MKRITCLAMGLAVSIGVLSACTRAPMSTAPQMAVPYVTMDMHEDIQQDHIKMMNKAAAKLNITDEQKAQIKQIIKKYRAQWMTEDIKTRKEAIKNLMLAADVDETAFANALTALHEDMKAKTSAVVDMMADLRAVLTDEQRDKAVELINKLDDKDPDVVAHHMRVANYLMEGLDLSADQQADLTALKDKVKDLRARKMEIMQPALASFVESGDKTALLEQIQSVQSELKPPIAEVVEFVNGLSLIQRQALVNKIELLKKMMRDKCAASPAPAEEPVVAPSEAPVVEPTEAPADLPTAAPSEEPVVEPSAMPSDDAATPDTVIDTTDRS